MKKRILSFLLALVMVAGLLPAAALTAFAAQYTVVGVSVQSDGVVCDDGWYYLDDPSIHLLYSDNSSMFASSVSPLYTDEECLDCLTSAPVLGEKYYFQVFAYAYNDTDYSATTSKSSIDIEGFCRGRVVDAYMDGAVYIITCSIIYGELTGGVKAVASGVEYDSAEGGYAPKFTTLKAVSTEGKELEHTMVDGNYSYYGAKSGCLYKTNKGTIFSDMLTTKPQEGETYYSYFLLDSIDGNLNIEEDLVDIQIPGYDVEYIDSYERDMGFTSLVVYKATKVKKVFPVYVGGVGMNDGDYLAVGRTTTQTTKPSGGYAYYKNGTLTLNNYSYTGKGCDVPGTSPSKALIYSKEKLTVRLVGSNYLTAAESYVRIDGIRANGLTIDADSGAGLSTDTNGYGIRLSKGSLIINGGEINAAADAYGIAAYKGSITINGGDITASGTTGILTNDNLIVNGGKVEALAIDTAFGGAGEAVFATYGLTVADGLGAMASTTVDGKLVSYVKGNNDNYKRVVITSDYIFAGVVYVGGVDMYDGDYLAVGATKTRTTKPSGGYAYYKDGKLTLNNYSYEGKGFLNGSNNHYAIVYTENDLTLELIGNNTLIQTDTSSETICVSGASLIVGGTGSLTNTDDGYGIYAHQDITINSGTIHSTGHYTGIRSKNGSVVINGGDVTAIGNAGIRAKVKFVANGGTITATCRPNSDAYAIYTEGSVIFGSNMTVRASTTVDGALGEYVAANHNSYKKITIHSHNFGTAWKYKEADGHAHVCSFCGEHDTVIKHTPDISAPTEKQDQKCTVCGYVIAPSLGHIHKNNLTKVTAKPATCTSDGNSEYYSCSCGKYFKDASASTEIKDKNSVIIKASHSFGTDWGYQDENGHAHACVCGTHDELIPHTPGAEATETTPQKCTECGYIITPALNHVHNLTKISAKPATCTEEGNAEFYICDGCSDWFEDAEGNVKIEDKASVKLIATGHAFGDEFKSDENEHWYECACGEKKDVDAHNDENDDGKCDACGYSSASAETEPAVTTPSDKTDDENNGGMPWWAILLIVVAVAGISVGVTVIVLKKKK